MMRKFLSCLLSAILIFAYAPAIPAENHFDLSLEALPGAKPEVHVLPLPDKELPLIRALVGGKPVDALRLQGEEYRDVPAFYCLVLGLLFHLIYLALRGYAAPPPNPSQFVWSGAHLFYISVIRSLNPGTSRGRPPRLAYLAPLLTLPFTLAWFFWDKEGSPLVNLLWGAGFAYIAFEILRSLLHSMQRGEAWAARYHALVLLMILFDEMVLLSGLFYQRADFARMNAYYAFDFLVTLALLLQPVALHKAVSA